MNRLILSHSSRASSADGEKRVKAALENIMVSDEAVEIINHASSVMLTLIRSSETYGQITMDEVGYMNEFISDLPNNGGGWDSMLNLEIRKVPL